MTDMIERAGRAALCGWNGVGTDDATMAAEWERMGPATGPWGSNEAEATIAWNRRAKPASGPVDGGKAE